MRLILFTVIFLCSNKNLNSLSNFKLTNIDEETEEEKRLQRNNKFYWLDYLQCVHSHWLKS